MSGDARPDQGVPRYEVGKLFFVHPVRARRAHREDHVADVGGAVVDGDPCTLRRHKAELAHDGAGLADGAGAVFEALVPVRRAAEDGVRIAGA